MFTMFGRCMILQICKSVLRRGTVAVPDYLAR